MHRSAVSPWPGIVLLGVWLCQAMTADSGLWRGPMWRAAQSPSVCGQLAAGPGWSHVSLTGRGLLLRPAALRAIPGVPSQLSLMSRWPHG